MRRTRLPPSQLALGLVAGLVAALLALGCARTGRPAPNVVLISIDTLRADRLGSYGGTRVETPAIDALARGGVRFAKAYSPVPLTLPAHWTIHTGFEPWHHGVVDNGMTLDTPPGETLAERFAAAGYDTAAFVSASILQRTFGLDRGFSRYDDGPAADGALDQLLHATGRAGERVDQALAWLRRERQKPFFLWLHLYDPHAPYDPPAEFRARYAQRPYDGEVAFVDTQVARLFAALDRAGTADDTLVVLLSDHGESLGEHGEQTHGILLYDATLHVPLIFRLPRALPAGTVRSEPVTLADVAPTVLALAGLPAKAPTDGLDLFGPALPSRRLAAISESPHRRFGWATLVAIREGIWKYVQAPRPELYRVDLDPAERLDRIAAEPARAGELGRAARTIEKEMKERLTARLTSEPDAEARAKLQALGYVGGTPPSSPGSPLSPASPPDPKDKIGLLAEFDRAYQLFAEGRLQEAQKSFLSLAEASTFSQDFALPALGRIARLEGRNREAEEIFLREVEHDPEAISAWAQLVTLAHLRGDPKTAVQRAKRLVELIPRAPSASRILAEALFATGDAQEAEKEWRRGLAINPKAGWLRLGFARFLIATDRRSEARRILAEIADDADLPANILAEAATEAERLARGEKVGAPARQRADAKP